MIVLINNRVLGYGKMYGNAEDLAHSKTEKRYYVFGKVKGGVLTVRFTYRGNRIRIIGAGYWRKGKNIYEKQNQI